MMHWTLAGFVVTLTVLCLMDGINRGLEGGVTVSLLFAVAATPLVAFADGSLLAVSVYLAIRGVSNPLKNEKN